MNTLVFGHPVQNSSSHAIRELLGVRSSRDTAGPTTVCESQEDDKSDTSHSH